MATIKTLAAGVSPYQVAATEPTVLVTTANGRPSTVAASTSVVVNGQAALNSLITTSQTGVFQGANVTINLEEQNFSTTNQVTSNTNYPSGNTGEIQYNSGANSFASDPYFTYTNSNVVTPGIRTNNYLYGNGAPFIGGGNAAIGNFVFSGDIMSISDANQVMSITGNGTGNIQVTSNGNIWTFNNAGNLTLPSNTSSINYANGSPYGSAGNYSNANVSSFLAAFGSNVVSTTGNITAGYFIGNGSQLTNITSSYGNANVVANLAALGSNPVSSTGNITAGNILTSGLISVTGNVTAGNLDAVNLVINSIASDDSSFVTIEDGVNVNGEISATGNITGGNIAATAGNIIDLLAVNVTTVNIFARDASGINLGANGFNNLVVLETDVLVQNVPLSVTGNITAGNLDATNLVINSIRSDDSSFVTIEDGVNVTSGSISAPENLSLTANAQTWTFADGVGIVLPGGAAIRDTSGGSLAIGVGAGALALGNTAVAIGYQAAFLAQGNNSVSIGRSAGETQGEQAVAIGLNAGRSQGNYAVAIGKFSANSSQGEYSVAIGPNAGFENQLSNAVSIGSQAGASSQGINSVAVGAGAAYNTQGNRAVAVGNSAGYLLQGINSVAIGDNAGFAYQGNSAVAIGQTAGNSTQGEYSAAFGYGAGANAQGLQAVAIGSNAGAESQRNTAVAIGAGAGFDNQGNSAVAIGYVAGQSAQGNNSIIINATGTALNALTANTFTVAPVRNDVANIAEVVFYNTTTKEITYGNVVSVAGNITGGNLTVGSGTITGGNVNGSNFNGNVAFGTGTVGGSGNITGGNILTAGLISATGNITGNYFIGNGSQLTSVAVPSQTILPTIQTITATARPAGLFGGGEGGANVTVANTIPVTEYGVIITAGTVSETYKTGALGSIPGTVSLTFTTGLNSTQYTLFAYVTSNAGTYYSDAVTGTSGICLLAGTQIALSDGTHKAIEHITYTDKLLSWDFDRGCYAETTAMWIKRSETGSQYNLLTFSDGTTLRTFDQHRIFNKQAGAFTYPMTAATPVGTVTVNKHGQEIILTNKQVIQDTIEYYNVITDYHMNLFSDSVLTSCRFNNIYPIVDMKFAKDSRTLRTRAEFENVPDRFFHGLRLAEQTVDIETVEWYVNRLLSTEVSTHAELAV